MFLESEVLQMYWNKNSKSALAFGKVNSPTPLIIYVLFKREQGFIRCSWRYQKEKLIEWILNATFLKCKVLIRWRDMTEEKRNKTEAQED